jgi:hypothetical protein
MTCRSARALLSLVGLAAANPTSTAAQIVRARVLDAASESALSNALVTVVGDSVRGHTDQIGIAVLHLRRVGANIVTVKRIGYSVATAILEVAASDTMRVRFMLDRAPLVMQDVVTTAAVAAPVHVDAFERRRAQHAGGIFVTRDDIERNPPTQTSELLRRVHGIELRQKDLRTEIVTTRGAVSALVSPDLCVMPLGRDGMILGPDSNINDIPTNEIYGIEVFPGPATIPAEYRNSMPNGFCGLVMVWTRSGATVKPRAPDRSP